MSTMKYGAEISGARRFAPPSNFEGAGRITFPAPVFSFMTANPSFRCNSRARP